MNSNSDWAKLNSDLAMAWASFKQASTELQNYKTADSEKSKLLAQYEARLLLCEKRIKNLETELWATRIAGLVAAFAAIYFALH